MDDEVKKIFDKILIERAKRQSTLLSTLLTAPAPKPPVFTLSDFHVGSKDAEMPLASRYQLVYRKISTR